MKFSKEIITSRQNQTVLEAVKLCDKKVREKTGLFRFDGIKLFEEAAEKGVEIEKILICQSKFHEISKKINALADKLEYTAVYVLKDEIFAKVSEEKAPEGIICVAKYLTKHVRNPKKELVVQNAQEKMSRVMLLEAVRDPGNLGTIIRSAAAFGINLLILSNDCVDIYNSKTVRGAMGALFKMNILIVDNIVDTVETLKAQGRNVYAAALDRSAVRLDELKFEKTDAVVVGNEGHGLSSQTLHACTKSLYIPMEEGSESLNAAVAASVIMWNMYR